MANEKRSCQRDPDMLALHILEVTRNTLLSLFYSVKTEVEAILHILGKHGGGFSTVQHSDVFSSYL